MAVDSSRREADWILVRWFEARWEVGRRTGPLTTRLLPMTRKHSRTGLGGGSLWWLILVKKERRWNGL